jgi:hypothetical protein
MTTTEPALLMTMSDIAGLARVQRPVVSMWRSRAANSDLPFPHPVAEQRGQELFDAGQVGAWLTETKRGNNPDASADAAAHAAHERSRPAEASTFQPISALLTLRSILGAPLGALSRDDLLDAADEHDPDDELLYREIECVAPEALPALARYVDSLVEAAYSEPAAFEKLMAHRSKLGLLEPGDSALSDRGLRLMATAAQALAATQSGDPVFVDAAGSAGDVLIAIASAETDSAEPTVVTPNDDSEASRLTRRRLLVHRIQHETRTMQNGSFSVTGSVVHVAHLPAPGRSTTSSDDMLRAIDDIVVQMDDDQLAVVLAPSSVLSDAGLPRQLDEARSALLRSGRVRAIVRLAAGLLTHKPQQSQTLWVLGSAHENVELADRWTMIADLTAVALDPVAVDDLVGDLVASLGDRTAVRAHAFRFARLVLTRTLLASRNSLVTGADSTGVKGGTPDVELAVRAEQLISCLNTMTDAAPGALTLVTNPTNDAEQGTRTAATTRIEQLVKARHLRYIPGNRLEPDDVVEGGVDADGIRVIGPAEVLGERALGEHRIDRLRFAAQYPSGRVTEPGDVVFCTAPRPHAVIDADGTSVVAFPARILRINVADPGGVLAELIVADIEAIPGGFRAWRRWPLRRVPASERSELANALAELSAHRELTRQRLAQLDDLTDLLLNGVAGGDFTVASVAPTAVPTKGII